MELKTLLKRALLIMFCIACLPARALALEQSEKLLFEKNSLYQYISVIEDAAKKERYLRNQKREYSQGGISLNNTEKPLFEYMQMSFVSLAFLNAAPADVLYVGLGVGAMPRYLSKHYPQANIDVAEIDPDVLPVAQKYFYFSETEKMKVHTDDGRLFIKRTRKRYDMIVLDAYQNDSIPFHLTTIEFLKEVKSRLKDNGIVVANIVSSYRNKFFDSMVMTYRKVFSRVYVFKGKKSINYIFVATTGARSIGKEQIESAARKLQASKRFDIDLPDTAARLESSDVYEVKSAKILTDDFAPVNLYKYQRSGPQ